MMAEQTPPITVELTGEGNETALAQLERHGCTVDRRRRYVYHITFPEGTVRRFHLRISHTDHRHLIFPDGWMITELITTHLHPLRQSTALYVPLEEFQSTATRMLTFRDLYVRHEIHLAQLAREAEVSPRIAYFLLEGQPVSRDDAIRVLSVLSERTGCEYSLETVHIELLNENGDDHDEQ